METGVTKSGREARRRRIVERGSDRMALITGRSQALASPTSPSSSSSTQFLHSHTQSSPAFFSHVHHVQAGPKSEDDASGISMKHDIHHEFAREKTFDFRSKIEPQFCESETYVPAKQTPHVEVMNEVQSSPITPRVPKGSTDNEFLPKSSGSVFNFFAPKEINSCILASENTRVFCSITIALLVVLSYINLPRKVKPKGIIASRPLYILLLTDVTIVVARLLLGKRRRFEKAKEEEREASREDGQSWAGAVKVLEIGLVVYQTVRAIFIDFSFYVVVVICGLSLM